MSKLTDAEIVKALECCGNIVDSTCKKCVYHETYNASCVVRLMRDALDLINRQKAEIEELKADKIIAKRKEKDARELYKDVVIQLKTAKSEAINTIREKCIEHQDFHKGDDGVFRAYVSIEDLDNIINDL